MDIHDTVLALFQMYHEGAIPRLAEHEVHPDFPLGSRERYVYFTFPVALNFQRSSPAMWRAALATWEDNDTRWVYDLKEASDANFEDLQRALCKHSLAIQRNKHPDIWQRLARTFTTYFDADPRQFLRHHSFDVIEIKKDLQDTHKQWFPYLGGLKMSNYWLYILSQYTDAKFTHMDYISIIPDTHVKQSSVHLGMVSENATSEEVELAWRKLLSGTEISPVQMHPVLWNWSRNNFLPTP